MLAAGIKELNTGGCLMVLKNINIFFVNSNANKGECYEEDYFNKFIWLNV